MAINNDEFITKGEVIEILKAASYGMVGIIPKSHLEYLSLFLTAVKLALEEKTTQS